MFCDVFFLMIRRPPRSTRTDTLFPYTTLFRTEYQLRQLQAEFARAARILTLGQLATSIAHEVNQPLSAIATNAETSLRWLSRDEPNLEKIGQLTARVAASAHHASEIVQDRKSTRLNSSH